MNLIQYPKISRKYILNYPKLNRKKYNSLIFKVKQF